MPLPPRASRVLALALLSALAACASQGPASRTGRLYLTPGRYYPPPGPPSDPWGPYIRQAAARFSVPEAWIRAVMRQESAGEEQALSPAGAIGLMQIMPGTYAELQAHYNLGFDPWEPHDNIMAGTAYIREMYDRFGSPGFLAAYNAGPGRVDSYLATGNPLPTETVSYVAAIAPRLGGGPAMGGPLSAYAAPTAVASAQQPTPQGCDLDAAYDPSRPCVPAPIVMAAQVPPGPPGAVAPALEPTPQGCDLDAAYDPSQPCVPSPVVMAAPEPPPPQYPAPSMLYRPPPPRVQYASISAQQPLAAGDWAVQVGAFTSPSAARVAATTARNTVPNLLSSAQVAISTTEPFGSTVLFRARLTNLSATTAASACTRLSAAQMPCLLVRPSSG